MSSADLTSNPPVVAPNATTFYLGCDISKPEGQRNVSMPAPAVYGLAADFAVASQTVLQNVPGMSVTLGVGNYEIRLGLHFNTQAVAAGYKWGWTSTCTFGGAHTAGGIAVVGGAPALFNFDPSTGSGNTQAAVTATDDAVTAVFHVSVTVAGNLQLQFAQGTSNATASLLKAGSAIVVTRTS